MEKMVRIINIFHMFCKSTLLIKFRVVPKFDKVVQECLNL